MRYIIGYAPNQHGEDAIALASALASTQAAELLLVHVLDKPAPADAAFLEERAVQETRAGWADERLSEALLCNGRHPVQGPREVARPPARGAPVRSSK